MPYLLLIHEPIGQRAERGEQSGRAVYDEMVRFGNDLQQRGVLLGVNSLVSQDRATRVQVREGQKRVLDGPFAEAKEMVGGYFLLDCATRDEAIRIAAECPAARWCTIEVRQVGTCYE